MMESGTPETCDTEVLSGESLSDSTAENGLTHLADARPSEVDAKPIIVVPGGAPGAPIVIPTERDSSHYVLEGVKKVFIFNQKTFASRL